MTSAPSPGTDPADLVALVPSWVIHLRAARKTEGTIKTYLDGVRPYLEWCQTGGHEPLLRASLETWTAELLAGGRSASTARTRMMPVRYFASWLFDEGEIESDPFLRVKAPKLDEAVIPVLTSDQLTAMLKACQPPAAERTGLLSLRHRRDEAIIRLLFETGMRAGECLALEVDDINVITGEAIVRRGKGGKGRTVSFGPEAAKALDRYQRVRRLHRLADTAALWLGDRGKNLAYGGLYYSLNQRAEAAGISDFNPHMFRHTSASRWLGAGGSESNLMARHGWSSMAMVQRYGKADRERRAIEEARKLNLGEL